MPIFEFQKRRPTIGKDVWIAPTAEIIGDVQIGDGCYIGFGAILRGDYGTITIGAESAIEEGVIIHARPGDKTVIGKRVTVGHMAMIHNATIKDYALIGMQALISDFAVVGEWSLIGEKGLVTRNQVVPDYKIYVGVPAREKGDIQEKNKTEWGLAKQLYADLVKEYLTSFREIKD